MKITKRKNLKPQSDLQKLQSKTNWLVHFRLQPIPYTSHNELNLSAATSALIDRHNNIITQLKQWIAEDYEKNKKRILKDREDFINGGE